MHACQCQPCGTLVWWVGVLTVRVYALPCALCCVILLLLFVLITSWICNRQLFLSWFIGITVVMTETFLVWCRVSWRDVGAGYTNLCHSTPNCDTTITSTFCVCSVHCALCVCVWARVALCCCMSSYTDDVGLMVVIDSLQLILYSCWSAVCCSYNTIVCEGSFGSSVDGVHVEPMFLFRFNSYNSLTSLTWDSPQPLS